MRIIYKGETMVSPWGTEKRQGVCIITPAPEFMESLEGTDLEKTIHLANKQLATGTKYEILDDSVDLSDRSLRTAWEYVAGEDERDSEDLSEDDLAKYHMTEQRKETI